MLQETKLGTEQQVESLAYFMRRYFECFSSKANAHSGGSSVLIRKGRGIEICPERETDHNGRISAVEVLYRGELHKLVSVFAPNDIAERKEFFIALREYVDTPCKTVLAGDFNCVLHAADCSRGLRSDVSRGELRKLLRDFDLQDVQECAAGPCLEYTHWQGSSHARLDRVYVSSELAAGSSAYDVQPLAFSDHALVTVVVGMAARPKNPSSWWSGWKLNESLLEDEVLRAELEEIIRKKSDGKVVDAVMWEELKQDVKLAAYRFSQERAACKKAKKRSLAQTLRTLIVEENKTPGVFTDDIRECKGRILELLEQEYKGAMIRSRTLTLERDEEPRKIFKTRERQHAGRNRIVKLHVGRDVVTRQEDIEAAFVKAYTTLLTAAENESLSGEYGGPMPRVSEELREQINRKIDVEEVKRAIKELAPRKSPGVDGLGSLFYKTFAEQLAPILRDVFADILRRGLLPPSMRQAVTVLIPKKHVVGPMGVGHFRPISLLTSDYKILAKILSKRLESGLRSIIGDHQTYGIKGRTIATNLHAMRIVCETAQVLQCPLAVLQVDLCKAFDRVCHSFLFSLLEACGIGARLLQYVKLCYSDISTRLLVNGNKTAPIAVSRSVRQGCPLSPILFALYLEPLCRTIISDANIKGLTLSSGSVKVLAYADDVAVVCSSATQVQEVVQHISDFCAASGAEMNPDKSAGAWLGHWDSKPENFLGIPWTSSVSKYLGVCIDVEQLSTGRGGMDLLRLRSKTIDCYGRHTSLMHRAYVCNSVLFPTAWYTAQVVPCASLDIAKVQRLFATFVWESNFERMRRNNLFLSQKKGGIGLVNVELKLLVQRFLFFRDQKNCLILSSFRDLGGSFLRSWIEDVSVSARSRVLKFYKEKAAAIEFFETRYSREYLQKVKKKKLYWDTLDSLTPPPLYRMSAGGVIKSNVFQRLRRYPVRVGTKNFFVRLHWEVLPVKTWSAKKGFFVPWSQNCALCPLPETLEHVFLYCTNAELFWAELRAVLRIDMYMTWKKVKFLEFGSGPNSRAWEVLALLGLQALWRSRTDHLHVVEGGKPAWRHFIDGFMYVDSLLEATLQPDLECWTVWKSRLQIAKNA
ncbi:hypothetical protein ISCGN_027603 [Ixodes scapularis]